MQIVHTPVLIVGGGPVGLTTALLLAQQNIPALLVEKHSGTAIGPRARGLNVRSMEILRGLGVEEAIRKVGAQIGDDRYTLVVETLAGKEIKRVGGVAVSDRISQLSSTGFCLCAQNELEPCLMAAAQGTSSQLQFGTELISCEQDVDEVRAEVIERVTGEQRTIHAEYMVAADGTYSSIRDHLRIGTSGRGALGCYTNIYFRADLQSLVKDRPFVMCFVRNVYVSGSLISVDNVDRWTLNVSYDPQHGESPEDFSSERCIELIRQAIGWPDLEVELLDVSSWIAAERVADHFRVGRIFFAGDAAHQMPPAGAFGMNTGIQDAHNLVWKLASVLRQQATPDLLKTYEAERRPLAVITVERASSRLESARTQPMQNSGSVQRSRLSSEQNHDEMAITLGYRYVSTAIIGNSAEDRSATPVPDKLQLEGEPGTRAPHIWLEQQGKRISTLDLFGTHFVVLTGHQGTAWVEAAQTLASHHNYALHAYRIGIDGDLLDPKQQWTSIYKIAPDGAVLVRPDGFVAWRSEKMDIAPQRTLEHILNSVLCR
jgi:putative polyketide hydroxylase